MTQRIVVRDAVQHELQNLSGYSLPSPGTTEEMNSVKLPAIVVGFATENIDHELHGGTSRI